MTTLTDARGRPLPEIEAPTAERLRAYGDMLFLAFRSDRHTQMPVSVLRTYLEPALVRGQFRIFRFDGIPRAMYTWAWLTPEAERRLVTGEPLSPEDWSGGERLWLVDLIAPYRGLMGSIGRWIMQRGNLTETEFLFRRVTGQNTTRRIVHVDFRRDHLAKIYGQDDFLATLPQLP
ncbi:MAG: toxin-activating lysine-acyltransferase [Paracoccaceae bacterium]